MTRLPCHRAKGATLAAFRFASHRAGTLVVNGLGASLSRLIIAQENCSGDRKRDNANESGFDTTARLMNVQA